MLFVNNSTIAIGERGLFTDSKIKIGEYICTSFNEVIPKDSGFDFDECFQEELLSHNCNHSDNPNQLCFYLPDEKKIIRVAARNIERGEELTCDYAEEMKLAKNLVPSFGKKDVDNWLWFKK